MNLRKFFAILAGSLLIVTSIFAQQSSRNQLDEDVIRKQLAEIAPKALDDFNAATEALDANDMQKAADLYKSVLKQAPDFAPALRRCGGALVQLGERFDGLEMTKKAVAVERSPENLISHAVTLINSGPSKRQPSDAEINEALSLAKEAVSKGKENDFEYVATLTQLALLAGNAEVFEGSLGLMIVKFPNAPETHYFRSLKYLNEGYFSDAESEISKAEELGFPREATAEIRDIIKAEKSNRFFGLGDLVYVPFALVGVWALGLAALFGAGKFYSRKTLKSIENSDPNDIHGAAQAGLRGAYRKLITIAGLYYYVSQPIVMFLVIAVAAGIILGFVMIGTVPIKIVLVVGFVALATVFFMVKSLVFREKIEDPGRVLNEAEAPELWKIVREVADAIETRPVNEIRLTCGAEVAVYERGGWRAKMQDKAERVLILGAAAIDGFEQNTFRAVLAHEYGHFSNRDTAGGDIAYRVNSDIIRLAESMAKSGTATFYNLAFHFLRFYHFLFRRITHGASRLQEVLADRVAVFHYGADAFKEGLAHVIRRDIEFNAIAGAELAASINAGRKMENMYAMIPQTESISSELEGKFNEALTCETTEDDTHPSPRDRFELADKIASQAAEPLSGKVWDLIPNREALTAELNDELVKGLNAFYYDSV